jgi:hypothetical protein
MSTIAVASTSVTAGDSHTRFRRRIRAGAVALVLAGVALVPVPLLMAGVPTNPTQNMAFAMGANTLAWRVAGLLSTLALACYMLGGFALYAHLARTRAERWAFAGLIITGVCLMPFLTGKGFSDYVAPSVGALIAAGHRDAIEIMDQIFKEPAMLATFLSGLIVNVGYLLTGIAVWRSGTLWKWGGTVLVIASVLLVPAFLDVSLAQFVAPLVWALGLIGVGISLWKRPTADETQGSR